MKDIFVNDNAESMEFLVEKARRNLPAVIVVPNKRDEAYFGNQYGEDGILFICVQDFLKREWVAFDDFRCIYIHRADECWNKLSLGVPVVCVTTKKMRKFLNNSVESVVEADEEEENDD